jgi:hypothetical protein
VLSVGHQAVGPRNLSRRHVLRVLLDLQGLSVDDLRVRHGHEGIIRALLIDTGLALTEGRHVGILAWRKFNHLGHLAIPAFEFEF